MTMDSRLGIAAMVSVLGGWLGGGGWLPAAAADETDKYWNDALQNHFFPGRRVERSDEIIELEAPNRAEDAALVPLRISSKVPQDAEFYVKTISLIIDKNPAPLAGVFHFTPQSGRADLTMRVRVNEYTPIRAIAETSDGRLTMTRRFVKASGGCSAPVGTDLDAAMERLGRMKLRLAEDMDMREPLATQLKISHPNITGLQMDQLTRNYLPAHFVNEVRVSYNGEKVFWAQTDISISENPNFRFYFVPKEPGVLTAEVSDNQGGTYTTQRAVGPAH